MKYFVLIAGIILIIISCSNSTSEGQLIYESHCENCHQSDGSGLGELVPELQSSVYFTSSKSELPCLIINGKVNEETQVFSMPASKLSDVELTNLLNFLGKKFGSGESVTLEEVKKSLDSCN